jgi:8-oxo-dGTP diphosphatase
MTQLYVATLAFKRSLQLEVALVLKHKGPAHLHGKWNGIGGKVEVGESPVGAAMRELHEEAGIAVQKDDMVAIEHQRFEILTPSEHHIYWYAVNVPDETAMPPANDIGEPLKWFSTGWLLHLLCPVVLAPNLEYLVPKARTFLRTGRLARPA